MPHCVRLAGPFTEGPSLAKVSVLITASRGVFRLDHVQGRHNVPHELIYRVVSHTLEKMPLYGKTLLRMHAQRLGILSKRYA